MACVILYKIVFYAITSLSVFIPKEWMQWCPQFCWREDRVLKRSSSNMWWSWYQTKIRVFALWRGAVRTSLTLAPDQVIWFNCKNDGSTVLKAFQALSKLFADRLKNLLKLWHLCFFLWSTVLWFLLRDSSVLLLFSLFHLWGSQHCPGSSVTSLDCFQNKPESPKNQGSTTPIFGHWRTENGVLDPKGQLTAFLSTLCQKLSLPCIPTHMVCLPHSYSLCRQSHLHSLQRPCQVRAPLHPVINI